MNNIGKNAIFGLSFALGMLFGVLVIACQVRLYRPHLRQHPQNSDLDEPILKKLRHHGNLGSKLLEERVRILCWVMTQPSSHKTKAQYSRMTWAKHCDQFFYISEGSDEILPVIKVNAAASRAGLWDKTREAFKIIHKDYKDQYDWVLKADDDSYVNMIALRKLLSPFNASEALFLGEKIKSPRRNFHLPQGYMTGGAGYVLSREAVRRFGAQLADNRSDQQTGCHRQAKDGEDNRIAECLQYANVLSIDTRDFDGFATFSHFSAEEKLFINRFKPSNFWYWGLQPWVSTKKDGIAECCTNRMLSFHYVSPLNMFAYNYLINNVNPMDAAATLQPGPETKNAKLKQDN